MPAQVSCPFCSYEVAPARAPTGALVCPMCRNTGKTGRPDVGTFERALGAFEARVVDHVTRLQQMLDEVVHAPVASDLEQRFTRLEDDVRNQAARGEAAATATAIRLMETTRTGDIDERVTQLEDRLEDVRARMDATATATAIRLETEASTKNMDDLAGAVEAEASTKNMDDLVAAVEALRDDIGQLHEEYEGAGVPALRNQVQMLAASVRALEERESVRHAWDDETTAEWERPEPETVREAQTAGWSQTHESRRREEDGGDIERSLEEPLVATAAISDPFRVAPIEPGPDFSDVPPVMDDGTAMRDLVARDAMAMSGAPREPSRPGPDALDGIESALHDIDKRLRTLRER